MQYLKQGKLVFRKFGIFLSIRFIVLDFRKEIDYIYHSLLGVLAEIKLQPVPIHHSNEERDMSIKKMIMSSSLTLVAALMVFAATSRAEGVDNNAKCDKTVKSAAACMSSESSCSAKSACASKAECSAKQVKTASISSEASCSAKSASASKAECSKSVQTAANAKVCPKTGKVIHQASYSNEKTASCSAVKSASSCDIDSKVIKNIETAALSGDFSKVKACSVSKAALKKVTEASSDFKEHSKELVIEAVASGDFSKVSACKTTRGEIERAVKQYAGAM